ncbi:MAG: lyase [Gammaproteobacteria bacterium]
MRYALMTTLIAFLFSATSRAAELRVEEWTVPWPETRPREPEVAPDGTVWFAGQKGGYVGRLQPETGAFEKVDLGPGTGPHNVIVDDAGKVWIAGNRSAWIGRYDPSTGSLEKFPTPEPGARDPHTLVFAPDGALWFTSQMGNNVGRLRPATGDIDLVAVPTPAARPYGIKVSREGRPWVALLGTNKLASVDPESLSLSEVALPRADARPRRLVLSSDGDVWYVDYLEARLGRYRPRDGTFREWRTPGGDGAGPYGMAIDAKDRVFYVETGVTPNRMVVFDTREKQVLASARIDSGAIRHMYYHPPSDAVWFGTDANTVGRARLE